MNHDRRHASSSSRRAFTLLEVMLVMAILVAVAAVAWPQIHRAYESVRLRKAADQVQAGLSHARVEAMSSGVTQVFRFEPNRSEEHTSELQSRRDLVCRLLLEKKKKKKKGSLFVKKKKKKQK